MYEYESEDQEEDPQLVYDIGMVPLIYGELNYCVRFAIDYGVRKKKNLLIYEGENKDSVFKFFLQIHYLDYVVKTETVTED